MRQKVSVRAVIKSNGKTLFLRRGAGRESILGKYELAGGSVDFKEQPRDALKRYIKNYLQTEVETIQLSDVFSFIDPDDPATQYIFIVYFASLKDSKIVVDGRYDKYLWQQLTQVDRAQLTNSTVVILDQAKDKQELALSPEDGQTENADTAPLSVTIYSDGGSRGNPGPSASAYVILDNQNQAIAEGGVYLGITTNNQAEYQAVYQALKKALELGLETIDFRLDSNLVVNQLNGTYKIKNRDLWPIYQDIKELIPHFKKISFTHVAREFNHVADGLVNKILDEQASQTKSDTML